MSVFIWHFKVINNNIKCNLINYLMRIGSESIDFNILFEYNIMNKYYLVSICTGYC